MSFWDIANKTAIVMSWLGIGLLSTLVPPIYSHISPHERLEDVDHSLEKCRVLYRSIQQNDLLCRILEKRYPGFINEFDQNIKWAEGLALEAKAKYIDVKKSKFQSLTYWRANLANISEVRKLIAELEDDRVKTSSVIQNGPVYRQLVRFYKTLSPEDFERKLNELLQMMPEDAPSVVPQSGAAAPPVVHVLPGHNLNHASTVQEFSVSPREEIALRPCYTIM